MEVSMRLRLLAVGCFWLLVPDAVQAQTVNVLGRVLERGSEIGVNAVSLRLLGTDHHVTSDSAGRFRIENVKPGEYTLEVSRLGYAARTQNVKVPNTSELQLEIVLTTAPIDLPAVTVRAVSEEERARRAEGTSTKTLTFEELRTAQAQNRKLEDVIRSAGFGLRVREGTFTVGAETSKMLCIEAPSRGASSLRGGGRSLNTHPPCSMVPVFIDGMKIENAGTYLLGFPLDSFDRIEWLSMIAAGTRFGVLANNKGALVLYSRTGKR
jgi:hypothetical protein